jgi:ethanolamine utilization protein EutA
VTSPRTLLSVGIDVGTTTTQIIFSRLALADVARPGQIPRVAITAREVIYQSPIAFTPLLDRDTVDAARLNALVRREYAAAGVDASQVRNRCGDHHRRDSQEEKCRRDPAGAFRPGW